MNLPPGPSLHPSDPIGPLGVAQAWRNGPALATLLITFVAVALLGLVALAYRSNEVLSAVSWFVLAVTGLGVTAAGSQFAEQASGRPVSGVLRAFAATPAIVLRIVVLAGMLVLVFAAFVLVVSAVLLACRLPVVGPVLYVVALPALTLTGAALLLALSVAALLSVPALWEGHSLRTVLSQLGAIAAQRKLSTFVNLLLYFLVAFVVTTIVTVYVLAGFGVSVGLSGPLSGALAPADVLAAWQGGTRIVDAGPYAIAGALAGALVLAITAALLAAVFLFGLMVAYLRSTDGIDIAAARAALGRAIVEIQVKKGQALEDIRIRVLGMRSALPGVPRGMASIDASSTRAASSVHAASPTLDAPSTLPCPRCDAPAMAGDLFCGSCGQPLSG